MIDADAIDSGPSPTALRARTENVVAAPPVRPGTVHVSGGAAPALQVCPPGEAVTT